MIVSEVGSSTADTLCKMVQSSWKPHMTVPTYYVGPRGRRGYFGSINDAIAFAEPYSRVEIVSGRYFENIVVNKPVEICVAKGDDSVEVYSHGVTLTMSTTEAYLEGLCVKSNDNRSYSILVESGCPHFFRCSADSIQVEGSAIPTVEECRIRNGRLHGVYLSGNAGGLFKGNFIESHAWFGVCCESNGKPIFSHNKICLSDQGQVLIRGNGGQSDVSPTFVFNRINDDVNKQETVQQAVQRSTRNLPLKKPGDRVNLLGIDRSQELENALNAMATPQWETRCAVDVCVGASPTFSRNSVVNCINIGIFIHSGAGGVFEANRIASNRGYGVMMEDECAPKVTKNNITDNVLGGIYARGNAGGTVTLNEINNNRIAGVIVAKGCDQLLFEGNVIKGGKAMGVMCKDNGNGKFIENEIRECNPVGIRVEAGADPHFSRNVIHLNATAICVCRHGLGYFEVNEISNNHGAGVLVSHRGNPLFERNRLAANGAAIHVTKGGLGVFTKNLLKDQREAQIEISSRGNPRIANNEIIVGRSDGIHVVLGGLGHIEHNLIVGNAGSQVTISGAGDPIVTKNIIRKALTNGITVEDGGLGTITENLISHSIGNGVAVSGMSFPVLRGNIVTKNQVYGLALTSSASGTYEKNKILNNTLGNVSVSGSRTTAEIHRPQNQFGGGGGVTVASGSQGLSPGATYGDMFEGIQTVGIEQNTEAATGAASPGSPVKNTNNINHNSDEKFEALVAEGEVIGLLTVKGFNLLCAAHGQRPTVQRNWLSDSPGVGVLVTHAAAVNLVSNRISGNGVAVRTTIRSTVFAAYNEIIGDASWPTQGVVIMDGSGGQVVCNHVTRMTDPVSGGIVISSGSHPFVAWNTITECSRGISCTGVGNQPAHVIENSVSECDLGVGSGNFSNPVVHKNVVTACRRAALFCEKRSRAHFSLNAVVDNVCGGLASDSCEAQLDMNLFALQPTGFKVQFQLDGANGNNNDVSGFNISAFNLSEMGHQHWVKIYANRFIGCDVGVDVTGPMSGGRVARNVFSGIGTGIGIVVQDRASADVQHNIAQKIAHGIVSARGAAPEVTENSVVMCSVCGLGSIDGGAGVFESNLAERNKSNVLLTTESNATFISNVFSMGMDSNFKATTGALGLIKKCIMVNGAAHGIVTETDANPTFVNCAVKDHPIGFGFLATVGGKGIVKECTFISNQAAISTDHGGDPVIEKLTIKGQNGPGVLISDGGLGTFLKNVISANRSHQVHVGGANSNPTFVCNTISSSDAMGVLIEKGARGRFENNLISKCATYGVSILAASPTFVHNHVRQCMTDVNLKGLSSATFDQNIISHSTLNGIVVEGENASPTFTNNHITCNGSNGVCVLDQATPTLVSNEIYENVLCGVEGIGCAPWLSGNLVFKNKGDGLSGGSNCKGTWENNTVFRNEGCGMRLRANASPDIACNNVTENVQGGMIVIGGAPNIRRNFIHHNYSTGIALRNSMSNSSVRHNWIWGNEYEGVEVTQVSEGSIAENIIFRNGRSGLMVSGPQARPTVQRNFFCECVPQAILVTDSSSPSISGNIVASCKCVAITTYQLFSQLSSNAQQSDGDNGDTSMMTASRSRRPSVSPLKFNRRASSASPLVLVPAMSSNNDNNNNNYSSSANDEPTSAPPSKHSRRETQQASSRRGSNSLTAPPQNSVALLIPPQTATLSDPSLEMFSAFSGGDKRNDEKHDGCGIVVLDKATPFLLDNLVVNNERYGVLVARGGRGQYDGNLMSGNGRANFAVQSQAFPVAGCNAILGPAKAGVEVSDGGSGEFEEMFIGGGQLQVGVYVRGDSSNPRFVSCLVYGIKGGYGVSDEGTSRYQKNLIANNSVGVEVGGNVDMAECEFRENGTGLLMKSGSPTISSCNIAFSSRQCVFVSPDCEGKVFKSRIYRGRVGVVLQGSGTLDQCDIYWSNDNVVIDSGSPVLDSCKIYDATGSGVIINGGEPYIHGGMIYDNQQFGVLVEPEASPKIDDARIFFAKEDGALVLKPGAKANQVKTIVRNVSSPQVEKSSTDRQISYNNFQKDDRFPRNLLRVQKEMFARMSPVMEAGRSFASELVQKKMLPEYLTQTILNDLRYPLDGQVQLDGLVTSGHNHVVLLVDEAEKMAAKLGPEKRRRTVTYTLPPLPPPPPVLSDEEQAALARKKKNEAPDYGRWSPVDTELIELLQAEELRASNALKKVELQQQQQHSISPRNAMLKRRVSLSVTQALPTPNAASALDQQPTNVTADVNSPPLTIVSKIFRRDPIEWEPIPVVRSDFNLGIPGQLLATMLPGGGSGGAGSGEFASMRGRGRRSSRQITSSIMVTDESQYGNNASNNNNTLVPDMVAAPLSPNPAGSLTFGASELFGSSSPNVAAAALVRSQPLESIIVSVDDMLRSAFPAQGKDGFMAMVGGLFPPSAPHGRPVSGRRDSRRGSTTATDVATAVVVSDSISAINPISNPTARSGSAVANGNAIEQGKKKLKTAMKLRTMLANNDSTTDLEPAQDVVIVKDTPRRSVTLGPKAATKPTTPATSGKRGTITKK